MAFKRFRKLVTELPLIYMMQGLALQDTAAQSTAPFSSFHVGTLFTNSRFLPGFF